MVVWCPNSSPVETGVNLKNNTEKQIHQMCVKNVFEERDNEGIIIRCVEPIMYNEHVLSSFRQKPLSIVLLPLLINNFVSAA